MVARIVGFVLLAFVVFGPAVIAAAKGDAGLAMLILATTIVTLGLGALGSWLILKGSPPPKEWEKG